MTFKTDHGKEFLIPKGDLAGLHKGFVIYTTLQCFPPLSNVTDTQFVTFFDKSPVYHKCFVEEWYLHSHSIGLRTSTTSDTLPLV